MNQERWAIKIIYRAYWHVSCCKFMALLRAIKGKQPTGRKYKSSYQVLLQSGGGGCWWPQSSGPAPSQPQASSSHQPRHNFRELAKKRRKLIFWWGLLWDMAADGGDMSELTRNASGARWILIRCLGNLIFDGDLISFLVRELCASLRWRVDKTVRVFTLIYVPMC